MELNIIPSEDYKTQPFVLKINYNETLENLIYTISLTITDVPVTEMQIFNNGRRLLPLNAKISESRLNFGDNIELKRNSSKCCTIL